MPDSNPILQLQKLAGRRTFDKGEMLYFQEAVHRFTRNQLIVTAIVQEIQEFTVKLSIVDGQYEGSCNCSDSEGFDFCKHCVAVALTDISREAELEVLQEGDEIQRITGYIESMSEAEAKATLLKQITSDIDKTEQWVLFADVRNGKINKKALIDIINKALPLREVWRQNRVKTYFETAIEKFNRLISILHKLPTDPAFELTQTALLRYNKALGKIKDDKGYRLKVEVTLVQAFATFTSELNWTPQRKVSFLMSLYHQPFSNFALPSIYKRFVQKYPELIELFIEKLVNLECQFEQTETSSIQIEKTVDDTHVLILTDLALYYAESGPEVSTENKLKLIECKHKLATNLTEYIELAELCVSLGCKDIARKYITEIESHTLNYRQESKLLTLSANTQEQVEDIDASLDLHWSAYERSLEASDFHAVLSLLEASDNKSEADVQHWFEKAQALLIERLEDTDNQDTLFELYLACDKKDIAIAEAQDVILSNPLLHKISKLGIEMQPDLGFVLYRRLIRTYPKNTDTQGYETAITLLKELKSALKSKKQHQSFDFLISELIFDFKQKRKFIALLQGQFGL
ncbi:SWIM zinc finger family protein [Brumicola pallidula]|jgi:uncharacterized Zn finger protein|uniref:SWIM-type domain-containing protein n=1 Tax=Brumicola pallidula DSM 14239 = ACAM 615 TaxID=1121922 RepID=K6YSM4_9ALTE|nr:hypothetical protein [Glaciecola pallidula]GAC26966.1 hypothetical protein GPAL_0084 [Glaciecola pallidula DSM 14239 = ACAM 615]